MSERVQEVADAHIQREIFPDRLPRNNYEEIIHRYCKTWARLPHNHCGERGMFQDMVTMPLTDEYDGEIYHDAKPIFERVGGHALRLAMIKEVDEAVAAGLPKEYYLIETLLQDYEDHEPQKEGQECAPVVAGDDNDSDIAEHDAEHLEEDPLVDVGGGHAGDGGVDAAEAAAAKADCPVLPAAGDGHDDAEIDPVFDIDLEAGVGVATGGSGEPQTIEEKADASLAADISEDKLDALRRGLAAARLAGMRDWEEDIIRRMGDLKRRQLLAQNPHARDLRVSTLKRKSDIMDIRNKLIAEEEQIKKAKHDKDIERIDKITLLAETRLATAKENAAQKEQARKDEEKEKLILKWETVYPTSIYKMVTHATKKHEC